MNSSESSSTISSIPPPLPPKHQRMSLRSITSTIRRSTSFYSSPTPSNELPPYSQWTNESESRRAKRPTSLFSWKSKRTSSIALEREDLDEKKAHKGGGGDEEYPILSDRKGRRIRTNLPPLPQLVIEVESLPSQSSTYTSHARRATDPNHPSSRPSLPEFRHSTFQPLDLSSTTPPTSSTSMTAVRDSDLSLKSLLARAPPSHNSSPSTTSSLSRRLEPRSPRIDSRPRSMSHLSNPTPSSKSRLHTPVSTPAPSMSRSTSFTLSLPTVAENPSPSRLKLRPIVIAPRKPSLSSSSVSSFVPSTPSTPRSGYSSSRSGSFSSTQTHIDPLETTTKYAMEDRQDASCLREKVDWSQVEKTLRDLSEERLQILLVELKKAKP